MNSKTGQLLPLWDLNQYIDAETLTLPLEVRYTIDCSKLLHYILEELNVAFSDREATSPIDMAVAYLKQHGVEELTAKRMCFGILHLTMDLVSSYFPKLTFLEMSRARFKVIDSITLQVLL